MSGQAWKINQREQQTWSETNRDKTIRGRELCTVALRSEISSSTGVGGAVGPIPTWNSEIFSVL